MGNWLNHTVITEINAPVEVVWKFWSDLDSMPLWMTWIESVKTVDQETSTLPDLTEWTLAANGFRFKWKAQITERIDIQKLEWKSVGGLPTTGAVRFYPEDNSKTVVKLKISYELPKIIASLMKENILGGIVTKELQINLDRFKELIEESLSKSN